MGLEANRIRAEQLEEVLRQEIKLESLRARTDYWIAVLLMVITLGSSLAAGIGGLAFHWSTERTALVAFIPGAMALIANTLKFEAKANWHYAKWYALDSLLSRLRYEIPNEPSEDDVSAISRERRDLIKHMKSEWDATLSLSWTQFRPQGHQQRQE